MSKTNTPRQLTAVVVKAKREKTFTACVNWQIRHPLYGKVVRKKTTLHVHDPESMAKEGDTVVIRECRPLSKTKSWELVEVAQRAL